MFENMNIFGITKIFQFLDRFQKGEKQIKEKRKTKNRKEKKLMF